MLGAASDVFLRSNVALLRQGSCFDQGVDCIFRAVSGTDVRTSNSHPEVYLLRLDIDIMATSHILVFTVDIRFFSTLSQRLVFFILLVHGDVILLADDTWLPPLSENGIDQRPLCLCTVVFGEVLLCNFWWKLYRPHFFVTFIWFFRL